MMMMMTMMMIKVMDAITVCAVTVWYMIVATDQAGLEGSSNRVRNAGLSQVCQDY